MLGIYMYMYWQYWHVHVCVPPVKHGTVDAMSIKVDLPQSSTVPQSSTQQLTTNI